MYERAAAIVGMPRSGTSWIGQIADSSPQVRYRMSPLFSWEFKNALDERSTREDWETVLRGAYASDNEFMNQTFRRDSGEYPRFDDKDENPPLLVVKYNRFQQLVEPMLDLFPSMRVAAIMRHPCGAIHSWLTAPKEFPPDADPLEHWRSGAAKKSGFGDFFGFDDWKEVARLHLRLERERPEQHCIFQYEDFVDDAPTHARALLAWFQVPWSEQTERFVSESQRRVVSTDYSVFKPPSVKDRWRRELQPEIRDSILEECRGTELERFLHE